MTTEAPAIGARPSSRSNVRARTVVGRVTRALLLFIGALVVLYPIWFLVSNAFKGTDQYLESPLSFPWPLEWANFETATSGGSFGLWLANSAIFSIGSVVLGTAVAGLAAFAIARMRFRGRTLLAAGSAALMIVPPVVMIIPLFVLFTDLDLVGTRPGVILIYAGLTIPFSVYMLTTFFRSLPRELFESAAIDGASPLSTLLRIVTPLSAPAIVTLVVVNLLFVWNDLLIALVFLPSDELKTLMVGVTVFRSRYNLDVPVTMAGLVIAALPMLAVYLVGQRFFIRGLTAGAVKG
jgi:raffinose/stachyose/melibiose transport system permease protein